MGEALLPALLPVLPPLLLRGGIIIIIAREAVSYTHLTLPTIYSV